MMVERDAIRDAVIAAQGDAFHGNGSVALLDREERANEGNAEVIGWCPTCQERAVPMRDGTCGFCSAELEALGPEEWPHTEAVARRQTPMAEDDRRPGQVKRAREGRRATGPMLPPIQQAIEDDDPQETAGEPDDALIDQERTLIDPTKAPILDWLELHGHGTATRIAEALNRKPGNVATRLRQYEAQGFTRRTGRALPGGRGGPQIEWELANPEKPPTSVDDIQATPLSKPIQPNLDSLQVRYFDALLVLLDHGCPEHIFDRCERIIATTEHAIMQAQNAPAPLERPGARHHETRS